MGWETLAFAALTGIKAASQISAAKKEAKAVAAEGTLAAQNKSVEIRRKAASAQVSFLNSGITLEGTPMGAIMGIYDTGVQDINQIGSVYNAKSKNIMSSARSKVISDIAGSVASAGIGSMASDFSTGFSSGFDNVATLQTGSNIGSDFSKGGIAGTVNGGFGLPWQSGFKDTPLPWA
jgi:hypothetical protein